MTAAVEDRALAVQQLEGLVKQLAVKFSREMSCRGDHYEDLRQEGICGLLRALDRFDPNRGVKFSSYAYWYINFAMQEYVARSVYDVQMGHGAYVKKRRWEIGSAQEYTAIPKISFVDVYELANWSNVEDTLDDVAALSLIYGEILNLPVVQQQVLLGYYFEHKTLHTLGEEVNRTRERVRQLRDKGLDLLKRFVSRASGQPVTS